MLVSKHTICLSVTYQDMSTFCKHFINLVCLIGRAVDKLKADAQEKGDLGLVAEVILILLIHTWYLVIF